MPLFVTLKFNQTCFIFQVLAIQKAFSLFLISFSLKDFLLMNIWLIVAFHSENVIDIFMAVFSTINRGGYVSYHWKTIICGSLSYLFNDGSIYCLENGERYTFRILHIIRNLFQEQWKRGNILVSQYETRSTTCSTGAASDDSLIYRFPQAEDNKIIRK